MSCITMPEDGQHQGWPTSIQRRAT